LPPHREWIEALVPPDVAAVAEELDLGESAGEEGGLVVLAHDDSNAIRRLAAMLRTQH
jgi:hypothetical protein